MSEENNWPDEVRLKMIERSEFYQQPSIYQYGYYDGYQKGKKEYDQLKADADKLVEALEKIVQYFKFTNISMERMTAEEAIEEYKNKYK